MPTKGDHPCDGLVRLLLHAEHRQVRLGGNRLDAFDLKKANRRSGCLGGSPPSVFRHQLCEIVSSMGVAPH